MGPDATLPLAAAAPVSGAPVSVTATAGERVLDRLGLKGEERGSPGNEPILLTDPTVGRLVVRGRLEVFAVSVRDGRSEGARDHLFTVEADELLLGLATPDGTNVALLAVGMADTHLVEVDIAALQALGREADEMVATLLDGHLGRMAGAVAAQSSPRFDVLAEGGDSLTLEPGDVLGSRSPVVWVADREGSFHLDGREGVEVPRTGGPFPLPHGASLVSSGTQRVVTMDTRSALEADAAWTGAAAFHERFLRWVTLVLHEHDDRDRLRLSRQRESDGAAAARALGALAGVLEEAPAVGTARLDDPLLLASSLVGDELGLRFRAPSGGERSADTAERVRAIARTSQVGFRRVVLSSGWWRQDNGPLLGFLEVEGTEEGPGTDAGHDEEIGGSARNELVPVALLADRRGGYDWVEPVTGERRSVREHGDGALASFAFQFYRTLPTRALRVKDLWDFIRHGIWGDLRTLVLVGVLGAALGLLLPILTGYVFDQAIPAADLGALGAVFVALFVANLAAAAFRFTQSVAALRLQTRISAGLQMAVFDRLLRLPLRFYRGFSVGDLTVRAYGINRIGDALGGATLSTLLSSAVSAGALFLLFYYSVPLALLALLIVLVTAGFTFGAAVVSLKYAREEQEAAGALSGLMLQLLKGIQKLRVAGTETRAFSRWAAAFHRYARVGLQVGNYYNGVRAFNGLLGMGSTLLLFWFYTLLATRPGGDLSTGQFIAFNAAFGMFVSAGLSLSGTAIRLLNLIPTWERARPILDAEPEVDVGRPDPGELTGAIEVSRLSFSYDPDGPLILDDVSLEAHPGEFIAVVGPSGAGKSTLLRVLLGFERPEVASVFYDGHDLATVDISGVRRQIGVVLQGSALTAGDVFTNIVGSSSLTLEDAWTAARMAGMEEDLHAMPMGMHTVVTEGGGTLSGGQRQRLMIARALAHRPRILFFDEATSALDNRTQKMVSESIEGLHATRVVIAHRLSTIRHADRIYVMEGGRVVQAGRYEELVSVPGLFRDLASRQEV